MGPAGIVDAPQKRLVFLDGEVVIKLPAQRRNHSEAECFHLVASAGTPLQSPGEDWSVLDGHFRRMPVNTQKVGRVGGSGSQEWLVRAREAT